MIDKAPSISLHRFLLDEFFPTYFKGESSDTRRTYEMSVAWFGEHLKHNPLAVDLTPENLQAFWEWGRVKFAKSTAQGALQRLRTLWRAAYMAGHIPDEPPNPWWWKSGLAPTPGTTAESKPPVRLLPKVIAPSTPNGQQPNSPGDYLPIYVLERGLKANSAKMLRYRLSSFERALGRPAQWTDLCDRVINLWLANMLETHSVDSVRASRAGVLALWRAAYESRIVEQPPTRIRKIKRHAQRPRCWTMVDLDQLLKSCQRLGGMMRRAKAVERRAFWRCWVLLGYYSGLRLGDLLALRWSDISTDGVLCVVQSKTGDLITCQLPSDVLAALSLLHGEGRERVFGDLIGSRNLMEFFKRIVHAAGLQGSTKWLRKSGASHVEAAITGAARAFLGHRSDITLAYAHYVDPTVAQRLKPMPPRIGTTEP